MKKFFICWIRRELHKKILQYRQEFLKAQLAIGRERKTNPSADKILKICEILHVTPYELLSERDEAIINNIDHLVALNDEEAVVLEGFRNLEKRKKERFLGYLAALQSED